MIKKIFNSPSDTAHALIKAILEWAKEDKGKYFNIALSGGNTPALMFDIWAEAYKDVTPWERLRFFWVDERCVPPTHSESNYGMTFCHLINKVQIPDANVFRIEGEHADCPEQECVRYAEIVTEQVNIENGLPSFNLVLLGAGDDGHTSSIFPGQESLLTTSDIYAVGVHPVTWQKRIALTGQPIINAQRVAFLMTGESKAPVLKDMEERADAGPAAYVAHNAVNAVYVFTDQKV